MEDDGIRGKGKEKSILEVKCEPQPLFPFERMYYSWLTVNLSYPLFLVTLTLLAPLYTRSGYFDRICNVLTEEQVEFCSLTRVWSFHPLSLFLWLCLQIQVSTAQDQKGHPKQYVSSIRNFGSYVRHFMQKNWLKSEKRLLPKLLHLQLHQMINSQSHHRPLHHQLVQWFFHHRVHLTSVLPSKNWVIQVIKHSPLLVSTSTHTHRQGHMKMKIGRERERESIRVRHLADEQTKIELKYWRPSSMFTLFSFFSPDFNLLLLSKVLNL